MKSFNTNALNTVVSSGKANRLPKLSAVTAVLGGAAFLLSASAAQAQTYVGDAYGAKIGINATLVGVGATIVDNPDLPSTGSSTALTNQLLNAHVQGNTNNPLAPLFTVLDASAIDTSTVGTGGVATSVSEITGANTLPSLGLNVGFTSLNLGSLLQADVIRSTTTANGSGNSGRTVITNLRFGANSLGNFDLTSANGSTTYYLNLLGGASLTPSISAVIPDVARVVINDQTVSSDGLTRTTNAVTVEVLQGNTLANGKITLASSTAGFQAAAVTAVPEAGTLALAGLGAVGSILAAGITARRRRTLAAG